MRAILIALASVSLSASGGLAADYLSDLQLDAVTAGAAADLISTINCPGCTLALATSATKDGVTTTMTTVTSLPGPGTGTGGSGGNGGGTGSGSSGTGGGGGTGSGSGGTGGGGGTGSGSGGSGGTGGSGGSGTVVSPASPGLGVTNTVPLPAIVIAALAFLGPNVLPP